MGNHRVARPPGAGKFEDRRLVFGTELWLRACAFGGELKRTDGTGDQSNARGLRRGYLSGFCVSTSARFVPIESGLSADSAFQADKHYRYGNRRQIYSSLSLRKLSPLLI